MNYLIVVVLGLFMPFFSPAEPAAAPSSAYAADSFPYPNIDINYTRLANRVHLSKEILEANPDLACFLQANYLHKHLSYHGHSIEVGPKEHIFLLYDGEQMDWLQVRQKLELSSEGTMQNHCYTCMGLVPTAPDEGLPTFAFTERYKGYFMVELITNSRGVTTVQRRQSHVWLRLINPEGAIISAGYFGDRPIISLWEAVRHLLPRRGHVFSPDLFEVCCPSRTQRITAIQINELQYHQLLHFLEDAQQNPKRCYQLLDTMNGQNCAGFAWEALRAAGLEVPIGKRLNLPNQVVAWQQTVERWRAEQMNRLLLETDSPCSEELSFVRFGLPEIE